MTRFIPLLVTLYLATLAAIPLQPRQLGWYSTDHGLAVHVLTPFNAPAELAPPLHSRAQIAQPRPRSTSGLNRARSFDAAFVLAVIPILFVASLYVNPRAPWDAFRGVFRGAL
jgi:hypothetical protein